jgi:hypothetical protein
VSRAALRRWVTALLVGLALGGCGVPSSNPWAADYTGTVVDARPPAAHAGTVSRVRISPSGSVTFQGSCALDPSYQGTGQVRSGTQCEGSYLGQCGRVTFTGGLATVNRRKAATGTFGCAKGHTGTWRWDQR